MTDFYVYTKASLMCAVCMFTLLWMVNGFYSALLLSFYTLSFLVILAAVIAASVTLMFIFYDWRNRKKKIR